jgi:SAM-dependent methyltransferase
MQLDAGILAEFYRSQAGQVARRAIAARLTRLWPAARGLRVLGFGFAPPYLENYRADAERVIAFMPAQTGVLAWPSDRPLTLLGDEDALPFVDSFFDRILVVHGLEGAESTRTMLSQLRRVLAPEGRLLIVAPNRTSLWAQVEISPFADGRPFNKGELDRLLRGAMFEPLRWDRALYSPPFLMRHLSSSGTGWEKFGRKIWRGMGGVHLVEAKKSVFAPTPIPVAVPAPKLARLSGAT